MKNDYIYINCASGIAGDMLLAALIDAGADINRLNTTIHQIFPDENIALSVKKVIKSGIAAQQLIIEDTSTRKLRHWSHINALINEAPIEDAIKRRSLAIIKHIAEIEANIHSIPLEKVHFHEIGAIDTIVDVIGCVCALNELQISEVGCSAVNVGGGTVKIDHGRVPVPAPATLALARSKNIPIYGEDLAGELATPTGMAILAEIVTDFSAMKQMLPEKIGYGAGERNRDDPNVVRITLGHQEQTSKSRPTHDFETDAVYQIDANIDDQTSEVLATVPEKLLSIGAEDAWITPIVMKKGRSAFHLTALASSQKINAVIDELFKETTTLGVRFSLKDRLKLKRAFTEAITDFGSVKIKIGLSHNRVITAAPEFEECKKLAEQSGAGLRQVMASASAAAYHMIGQSVEGNDEFRNMHHTG